MKSINECNFPSNPSPRELRKYYRKLLRTAKTNNQVAGRKFARLEKEFLEYVQDTQEVLQTLDASKNEARKLAAVLNRLESAERTEQASKPIAPVPWHRWATPIADLVRAPQVHVLLEYAKEIASSSQMACASPTVPSITSDSMTSIMTASPTLLTFKTKHKAMS